MTFYETFFLNSLCPFFLQVGEYFSAVFIGLIVMYKNYFDGKLWVQNECNYYTIFKILRQI